MAKKLTTGQKKKKTALGIKPKAATKKKAAAEKTSPQPTISAPLMLLERIRATLSDIGIQLLPTETSEGELTVRTAPSDCHHAHVFLCAFADGLLYGIDFVPIGKLPLTDPLIQEVELETRMQNELHNRIKKGQCETTNVAGIALLLTKALYGYRLARERRKGFCAAVRADIARLPE